VFFLDREEELLVSFLVAILLIGCLILLCDVMCYVGTVMYCTRSGAVYYTVIELVIMKSN
jgi:hypothetical protein